MGEAKGTLRVGLLSPLQRLDPTESQDFQSGLVLYQVYETPFAPPFADDPPEPLVFDGPLRRDADRRGRSVVSGGVREGIRFADGTPLTAREVVQSLSQAPALREQADVEEEGGRVLFVLKRPHSRFELTLTQRYCSIVRHQDGRAIGTGPYVIAPDSRAERVRLVRNPHYRQEVPIEEVVLEVYPPDQDGRPTALVDAVTRGDVDFTNALSREELAPIRGVRKWFEPGCSTALLFFNTERPYLASPTARRAIAHALSRTALTKICYSNALAFKASGVLPPMMGIWRDGLRHDPEKARELFSEVRAAFPPSLTLSRIWGPRPYIPHPRLVAEAISVQLRDHLGLRVEQAPTADSNDFYARTASGDYDLMLAGWIADTPDPADFLEAILSSEHIQAPGGPVSNRANRSRYRNPAMDEALRRFRLHPDDESREAIYALVREEVPVFPLMYGPSVVAHSWRVRNFRLSPLGIPFFARMRL